MLDRRHFLLGSGAAAAVALGSARATFAGAPTDNRLVFIILRGGLDGLHALAPYADKNYRSLRPRLALASPGQENGVLDVNGYFGMHPALRSLHTLYKANELVLVPASSTRYRMRSHFDGQNMLENGSGKPYGAGTGWLNRAISGLNAGDRKLGLALGPAVPLILQGDARVQTWANSQLPKVDEDFLTRMSRMYNSDPLFAVAIADAQASLKPNLKMDGMNARPGSAKEFALAAKAAANLLSRDNGPRIAVMELQGWDTHFRQEERLSALFAQLSQGVRALKDGLGAAWAKTAIVVVSEFGRTVAENGSSGTDHGTGGIAMVAGGAIAGGKIAGKWPGLSGKTLFEGRDVHAVNDYESIFKSALVSHMGLARGFVEDKIFPNSGDIKFMDGLFRNA